MEEAKDGKPEIPLEDVVITDEDLVPLDLFDRVVEEIENKVRDRNNTIRRYIKACQLDVKTKQERIDSDKLKKTVEQNVLITFLNNSMEVENDKYFTNIYIHR